MPVIINERKNTTHPHLGNCDCCGGFYGWLDNSWLQHNGYAQNDPKINLICKECQSHWHESGYDDRALVKGFGRVPIELLTKDNKMNEVGTQRTSRTSREQLESNITWETIDELITQKNCKVNHLATELNANPNDLRGLLQDHYGNRIVFKRGRNGGVFWNETPQESND